MRRAAVRKAFLGRVVSGAFPDPPPDVETPQNSPAADAAQARARPRLGSLRGRAEFEKVYREGRRTGGTDVSVVVRPGGHSGVRVGIAVGRSAGGAVRRNRLRRRVREALRRLAGRMRSGYDVVVVARPPADRRPFPQLVSVLGRLLAQAGVVDADGGPDR
ncbi:MAG: ribonuclease P protein component [Armatimonadota bacterium]|nr:ribonuclease P protein component [Armatimonadota bacterium]